MAAALPLRSDCTAGELRRLARNTRDANQARRLLALSTVDDEGSRGDAARIGGVGLQIVRDWVVRFNAHGPGGLIDRHGPGASLLWSPTQRRALVEMVERGQIPAVHGVVRWRLVDLAQGIWEEFRVSVSVQTISRHLRELAYRKLSARPRHHAQAAGVIEHFKRAFPTALGEVAREKGIEPAVIETCFADEARICQKNKITRRWSRCGTRPSAPQDQRTAST